MRFPWNALKVRTALASPSLTVTAGSYNSGTTTVTLTVGTHTLQVGQFIYVNSLNPTAWNGTFAISAITSTSLSYVLSTTGSYVSGGVVTWAPVFGFRYIYTLPSDCLRSLYVNMIEVSIYYSWSNFNYVQLGSVLPPFKIENGKLLSNEPTVDLLYLQLQNPPTDPLLLEVLVARAAAELAFPISHDNNVKKEKLNDYMIKLREMLNVNSMQGTPDLFQETSWIQARQ